MVSQDKPASSDCRTSANAEVCTYSSFGTTHDQSHGEKVREHAAAVGRRRGDGPLVIAL